MQVLFGVTTLLGEKLEENTCITLHKVCNILCLNRTVLETASIRHRRYQNNFKDIKSFQNKQLRFSAYRQYTAWVHCYETLEKGCRVVIPACVVKKIRKSFPEKDGKYTGFKAFVDL
ncbi:P2X purinoceptor 7-like [Hydractinia symbiolongicarpus]|uniref:P2X purinoceptor 7-like n=1 Tax=Hydractinia symbiolongicarpus TaxID=13093 RepID=UPI0025511256|nr:P2X purinoceptor 7-like [Hydractinia symbiolongicarpus]